MPAMVRPRVSVLLPVRDAARTLPAALKSIARQTLADWECIAVDDGSRDDSGAILHAAAARDPRIVVVTTPPDGIVAALGTGLARCGADLVARMDADDLMHRHRLELQRAALEASPELAAVGTHVRIFPRAGLRDGRRDYERWLNAIDSAAAVRREAFVECPIAHPTLMVRRDVLAAHGYRDAGWAEDYDLVLRLLAAGAEIGVVPRRLLAWRDETGRLSRTHPAYGLDRFTACRAHHLARGFLADTDDWVLWGHGGTGRALRRALAALGKRPSHVVELHPGRLGNRIDGAPVVPPDALATLGRRPLVASVAGASARAEIRAFLARLGWIETRDFVCAA
jgi:glycosyltransferase involved in cell wall biosynthesis